MSQVTGPQNAPPGITVAQQKRPAMASHHVLTVLRIIMTVVMGIALVLSGCTVPDESAPDCLPEPTIRRVDPPVHPPEQQARQEEVDQFLCARYQAEGWQIVDTTQTYVGDIIDWLDPASVPGSQEEPPPKPSPDEMQLSEGAELQVTELDMYPELRGPEGTIPKYRPSFAAYVRGDTGASSVEDFITNYQVAGAPIGQNRLYAGIPFNADNNGLSAWLNQFVGDVEIGTFSLIEVATLCRGPDEATTLELIGAVASRDKANFDDAVVRLQVEFFTAGPNFLGPDKGGWDGFSTGFVDADKRPYGPGLALVPLSTVNGVQYESFFRIQLFNGKWWVGHNGNWLGYYKGELFKQMTNKGSACEVDWYGEIYDPDPTDWTWTDMGSGQFADTGLGSASYVRLPVYYDTSGVSTYPDGSLTMTPFNDKCYTRSQLLANALGQPYFFCSGPGGDAPGCD